MSVFKKYSLILILPLLVGLSACSTSKKSAVSESSKGSALSEEQQILFSKYFFDASKEKMLGNYDLALEWFTKCLSVDKENAAVMYEIALIYGQSDKKVEALYFARKAASSDRKNIWYQDLLVKLLHDNNKFDEAASVLKTLIKEYPDRIDFYYDLATVYIYSSKLNESIKIYDSIEEKIGITEEISVQKEKIYVKLNNKEKAIQEIKKLIATSPRETRYLAMLAELYQALGMEKETLEVYNEILQIEPDNPYVQLSLSEYYNAKGEKQKSYNELLKAFSNPNLDIDTKIKILLTYYSLSEEDNETKVQAYELCKILIDKHPEDAKSHAMYGDFLSRDKRLLEARESYRKAVAIDKDKFLIWSELLRLESELNDFDAMIKESTEAIELFPNQAYLYLIKGTAYLQSGNYSEAIKILNLGITIVADNNALKSLFYSTLGDTHNKNKNNEESDKAYEKSLQIEPKNAYVLNNYSYYLSLRKDSLMKAEKMSRLSLQIEPNNSSYQDTYGWILYQQEKYEDAKFWIEKAIQNGEVSGVVLEHYGDVLYKLNQRDLALEYWNKAKVAGNGSEFLNKKIEDQKLYE